MVERIRVSAPEDKKGKVKRVRVRVRVRDESENSVDITQGFEHHFEPRKRSMDVQVEKGRKCKYCNKPYLEPCDGDDSKCSNKKYVDLLKKKFGRKK